VSPERNQAKFSGIVDVYNGYPIKCSFPDCPCMHEGFKREGLRNAAPQEGDQKEKRSDAEMAREAALTHVNSGWTRWGLPVTVEYFCQKEGKTSKAQAASKRETRTKPVWECTLGKRRANNRRIIKYI